MSAYHSTIRRATDALAVVRDSAPAGDLSGWSSGELMAQISSAGELRKACDALLVSLSGELASRSPRDDSRRNLTRQAGFASPAALVAETAGINIAESAKLGRVAAAIEPVTDATVQVGTDDATAREPAPKYAHVHDAFTRGQLNTEQVDSITRMLDDTISQARLIANLESSRPDATPADTAAADQALAETVDAAALVEAALVELAPTVRLNDLKKAVEHSRGILAPDQLEHRERLHRAARALRFVKKADGMVELVWLMPAEHAALVRAGIDAGARALGRGGIGPHPEPAGTNGLSNAHSASHSDSHSDSLSDSHSDGATQAELAKFDLAGKPLNAGATQLVQLRADAAFHIFEHAASCRATGADAGTPVPAFHAVVRVNLETLQDGVGVAELDGLSAPVSAGLARRLAAKAGIIPAVMGSGDIPLNLGMKTRLFTPAQRIALINRDGGCAWPGCDTTPEFSDAHHLAWWAKDHGPTDITNGIMLCASHHHRIHDNGWHIEFAPAQIESSQTRENTWPGDAIRGGPSTPLGDQDTEALVPWFIPPAEWIAADPLHRTRFQGGNPARALERILQHRAA